MSGAQAWGTALLRVVLGVIYVMHGYFAVTVLRLEGTAGLMVRMGYPPVLAPALAWYLILAHFAGGALMIAGLWTRLAALLQVPIMASVLFLLHLGQGFFLCGIVVDAAARRAVAGGYEYALLLLAVTLALALGGGGAASLDDWLAARPRIRFP